MAESEEDRHLSFTGGFDCDPSPLPTLRHSASHVMAQAVKRLFPDVKLAIGPAIEDGFYYDFAKPDPFTPEDLAKIEALMHELVRADLPFVRRELPRAEAIRLFRERGEPFKVEILEGIDADLVSLYRQGEFEDLCRGPHVPSTGHVTAFKLLSSSGAYWRGDERNPILLHKRLWEQSGHWEHYQDNMFQVEVEGQLFTLKPMNCPPSAYVYRRALRSYRDLPLRFSEMGRCHRNERSGTLTGLVRVRQFTQDDAHIYCRPDQLEDEITALLELVREWYKVF